ncbi:MAG: type II toxin-antitoxin system PemK/MazF family toxin [Candidatus Marinimicrobia bacterium]|nr:type II toxin-antitoxin system PemK/MazF family toxin [Candidatus Neomarinimicrobiota bacterium]MCH8067908.1 type II toxin-antitoxin system PemK/MazF family toxin [Candidatus Neomarinimicrobiota bacterium]
MKRGEVWWINFDPSIGVEIRKKRPAVIVSNNMSNKYLNRVQVIPLTSNIDKLYPSEAYIILNGKKGKAMADQLTTVIKLRVISKAGELTDEEIIEINKAIKTQLALF